MKELRSFGRALLPWAGLVIGLIAGVFVHQFGSDSSFDHCGAANPGPVLVVAVLGLAACVVSGLVSWGGMRRSANEARRVVSVISIGMAALFAFFILLAMIATVMLPPCFQ